MRVPENEFPGSAAALAKSCEIRAIFPVAPPACRDHEAFRWASKFPNKDRLARKVYAHYSSVFVVFSIKIRTIRAPRHVLALA